MILRNLQTCLIFFFQNIKQNGVNDSFETFWPLVLYHVSFFIFITTIGLNIIFGIIVDTFSELRDLKVQNKIYKFCDGQKQYFYGMLILTLALSSISSGELNPTWKTRASSAAEIATILSTMGKYALPTISKFFRGLTSSYHIKYMLLFSFSVGIWPPRSKWTQHVGLCIFLDSSRRCQDERLHSVRTLRPQTCMWNTSCCFITVPFHNVLQTSCLLKIIAGSIRELRFLPNEPSPLPYFSRHRLDRV